jgi:hypothetical protein
VGRGRYRSGNAYIARDAHAKARALDLDFGETGFIQQQSEFTNERSVAGCELCGCFVVRLARHDLDPELSVSWFKGLVV